MSLEASLQVVTIVIESATHQLREVERLRLAHQLELEAVVPGKQVDLLVVGTDQVEVVPGKNSFFLVLACH